MSEGITEVWRVVCESGYDNVFLDEDMAISEAAMLGVDVLRLPLATTEQVKDTERLDWLERDHNAVVHPALRGTGDDVAFGVAVKHEEGSGFSPNGKLREAIDAARAARPEGRA